MIELDISHVGMTHDFRAFRCRHVGTKAECGTSCKVAGSPAGIITSRLTVSTRIQAFHGATEK